MYDSDFLKELDESRSKITYARIISLDIDENPIEQIEGQVTQGSVNVDGTSAVRRTCSLTLVALNVNINEFYWGLKTKFKLEIGVQNTISRKEYYEDYPEIIWFKMGTYVITSFNTSITTNNYLISISGKDKMCLLNGDVGGIINATTDFGTYDYTDAETNITTNYKYPIKKILWDMVHAYANEPFHNIILNDLDDLGLELLEYKYDVPLYIIRGYFDDGYTMMQIGDKNDLTVYLSPNKQNSIKLSKLPVYEALISSMIGEAYDGPTKFYIDDSDKQYVAAKIEYGLTAGYRTCDLVYAGDLIANVGETVTSVLDKIKNMLGLFEYFYDLDGRFVFQRQKSLVNTVWTPLHRDGNNELFVESLALASNVEYNFQGNILLSSIQNNPNLLNLRNDYTVWGKRKSVTGIEYPIHMRYAIDNKPTEYTDYKGRTWTVYSEDEIEAINKEKSRHSIRSEIEEAMENFERTEEWYPEEVAADPLWWELKDWAEYYAILFGQYPGVRIPYDYMMYYCTGSGDATAFQRAIPNSQASGGYLYSTQTLEILYFDGSDNNGVPRTLLISHGSNCTHTYATFVELQEYVNSGFDPEKYPQHWGRITSTTIENYRLQGLFRYLAYCYNPVIPQNEAEERYKQLIEEEIEYIDPHTDYQYSIDWREIIYRMAIDYRKHNHDDDFEILIAKNNSPLYPRGITGYELYYTDLEGFWRLLYYPILEGEDSTANYEYLFITYKLIKDLSNSKEDLYVRGVYKPISQKVRSIPEELLSYNTTYVEYDGAYYFRDLDKNYYKSTNNGFTFSNLSSTISNETWAKLAAAGQLYTREKPSVNSIYKIYKNGIYPYLDTFDYTKPITLDSTGTKSGFFVRSTTFDDPLNPIYTEVTANDKPKFLTSGDKASLYVCLQYEDLVDAQEAYEDVVYYWTEIINEIEEAAASPDITVQRKKELLIEVDNAKKQMDLEVASAQLDIDSIKPKYVLFSKTINYNVLGDFYIYDSSNLYALTDIIQNTQLKDFYFKNNQAVESLETFTLNNDGSLTASKQKNNITYYQAYSDFYDSTAKLEWRFWNKNVFDAPESLNFWFDFLEGDGELRQYTTQAVGDRPKAVNEATVKSIYYRDTPKIIWTTAEKRQHEDLKTGYMYFDLSEDAYDSMFAISSLGIDAKNRIDELIYQYSYCTESITIQSIPIYYLQPNYRIHVFDKNSRINGDYVVQKLTYPLSYNGMMTINATKAPENSVTEREE